MDHPIGSEFNPACADLAMDVKGPKLCVLSQRPQTARLGWGLGTKCPILGHFVPEPSLGVRITKIDLNLCDWYPNAFFMVFEAFGTHLKLFSLTPRRICMMVRKRPLWRSPRMDHPIGSVFNPACADLAMDPKGPKLCVLSQRPQTARLEIGRAHV